MILPHNTVILHNGFSSETLSSLTGVVFASLKWVNPNIPFTYLAVHIFCAMQKLQKLHCGKFNVHTIYTSFIVSPHILDCYRWCSIIILTACCCFSLTISKLRSSVLDIQGHFSLVNALRSIRPGGTHTLVLAFSPTQGKKVRWLRMYHGGFYCGVMSLLLHMCMCVTTSQ